MSVSIRVSPCLLTFLLALQTERKLDGSIDVQLILTRALDRESRDLYEVKVVAYDGGSPPRSGTVDVQVVVTDANDNGPVFEYSSHYEATVAENIAVGTTVAKVTAFDADAGINAEVSKISVANFNPLMGTGSYSVISTSNSMKVVHCPLMGGLLHLVQLGGDWVAPQPAQAPPRCTNVTAHPSTASVPITVLLYNGPVFCDFNEPIKGLTSDLAYLRYQYGILMRLSFVYRNE